MNTEDFQLFIQGEYDRLLSDLSEPENHSLLDLISYRVLCESHAEEVLAKSKEVLLAVDKIILTHDILPDKKEWRLSLPAWFVSKCSPEKTSEEAQKYLFWWDELNLEQKLEQAKLPQNWSLLNWLSYFNPEQRHWYWWDAKTIAFDRLIISVEVRGYPFSSGSLDWLLRASGAILVEEIEEF